MRSGCIIGIRRPGGLGTQAVRAEFAIKNTEFLEKSNRVIDATAEIWNIGIDLGVNGLKENGEIWRNNVRVILFCDVDIEKRAKFHDFVKSKIKDSEIEVVGKRPTFAKIEIDNKEIIGQDKTRIAEIIVEKVYKMYYEIIKCFDDYSSSEKNV